MWGALVEDLPEVSRLDGGVEQLTIARGRAEGVGAEPAFSNAPDGGAVATLVLPAADPAR